MGEANRRGDYYKRKAAAIEKRENAPKPTPRSRKPSLALTAALGVAASMGLLARRSSDPEKHE